MYRLVAGLSIIIRGACLPNPFEQYPNGEAINWLVGLALYPVTRVVVGLFYKRGGGTGAGQPDVSVLLRFAHLATSALCKVRLLQGGNYDSRRLVCVGISLASWSEEQGGLRDV